MFICLPRERPQRICLANEFYEVKVFLGEEPELAIWLLAQRIAVIFETRPHPHSTVKRRAAADALRKI